MVSELKNEKPVKCKPTAAQATLALASILFVAALIIVFNDGIAVGYSNHTGLIPVARQIIDPGYLPGDFNISLRFYHHRTFAYAVAGLSSLFGEDNALILLNLAGMLLVSASLFALCRSLRLSVSAFIAAGFFLAIKALYTGGGVELNNFIGNNYIMPTTFAHSFILLTVASLMKNRLAAVAFLSGLVVISHLQIGLIFILAILPILLFKLGPIRPRLLVWLAVLCVVPALIALWHLLPMIQRGLMNSSLLLYYLDFRQPHHFEIQQADKAVWALFHLGLQAASYLILKRMGRIESKCIGILFVISLTIASLTLIHLIDYYFLKTGLIIQVQFLRLTPLITVFGMLSLITFLNALAEHKLAMRKRGRLFNPVAVNISLILFAVMWSVFSGQWSRLNNFTPVKRYADTRSDWVDICKWVGEHGPADTVYLTPPGNQGFTYLSNRSNVVEYKINPDGGQYLQEWFERLKDLSGGALPEGRGFENGPLLNQKYGKLSSADLIALGEKYRAKYAILPNTSPVEFETRYQNEAFRLVVIPIEGGSKPEAF